LILASGVAASDLFFLKKTLDFLPGLCYYNTREREGNPPNQKG